MDGIYMQTEIEEVKTSYYEYISKISEGCQIISNELRNNELESSFHSIANFAEGLQWLLQVEEALMNQGYEIKSRIAEAAEFMNEINDAIEQQDFTSVADLFEYEIKPIFSSASEWIFTEKK